MKTIDMRAYQGKISDVITRNITFRVYDTIQEEVVPSLALCLCFDIFSKVSLDLGLTARPLKYVLHQKYRNKGR